MPSADASNLGKIVEYVGSTTAEYTNGFFYKCTYDGSVYKWEQKAVQECETIQLDAMPTASVDRIGTIVQYTGTTTSEYKKGYFYECVLDGADYKWEEREVQRNEVIQFSVMPIASSDTAGAIVQYIGASTSDYTNGHFYECEHDGSTYIWREKEVQDSEQIQFNAMPAASAALEGVIIQYTGTSTSDYINGYFYECVYDGSNHVWENKPVQQTEVIQFTTMPAASMDLVGKIGQYIGASGGSYVNGYFYECVADTSVTPTVYSWVRKNVQPQGSAASGHEILDNDGTAMTTRDSLQFAGDFETSDNQTDERTVVAPHELTGDEWNQVINKTPEPINVTTNGHEIQDSTGSGLTQRDVLKFAGDFGADDDNANSATVITPHEMTNAEWNEVISKDPAVNTDGVIIDIRGNEYVIGKYIQADGKTQPLYQKTYTFGAADSSGSKTLDSTFGVDKSLVAGNGTKHYSSGDIDIIPNLFTCRSNSLIFSYDSGDSFASGYANIQYTKTTDTPI
jgi:hypothetical protein